jgi:GH43 family beta-xylosidase
MHNIKPILKPALLASAIVLSLSGCQQSLSQTNDANKTLISDAYEGQSFTNPLYNNGADPWLEYFDGNYYLTTTTWTSQLVMRKAPTLAGLAEATPVYLWSETDPARCCNFWAYEFHRLKGPDGYRWYMMFTSGKQENLDGQHLSVLESAGDDPMGPYEFKGSPMPDSWNIDGNYLQHNGKLYLLWSEWVGDEQLNWIAEMVNPWTITGPRVVLSRPELPWEISGRKVNEGAEVLKRNGRTFVVYSASFCDTPDYKLGLLELTGDDPLNPADWTKYDKPVFERANGVYGPGHNGFFKSPDNKEDWLVYHGNNKETDGCSATRSLRAQPFSWHDDGTPNFGQPVPEGQVMAAPSGENGPIMAVPQGADWLLRNSKGQCLSVVDGAPAAVNCSAQSALKVDPTTGEYYRLVTRQGRYIGLGLDGVTEVGPWRNKVRQQWRFAATETAAWQLINKAGDTALQIPGCDAEQGCSDWHLLPAGKVAISSSHSGKVLSVAAGQPVGAAKVSQTGWQNRPDQHWQFSQTEQGTLQLRNATNSELCMAVEAESLAAGAPAVMAACDAKASHWLLQPNAYGSMRLVSAHSKAVLEVPACALADDSELKQAPLAADSFCQRFQIRAID